MRDVELDEVKIKIIPVEDFKNYFQERKIITKKEYKEYLKNINT